MNKMRILILFNFIVLFVSTILNGQTSVAVVDFYSKGLSQDEASALTDRLRNELFHTGSFKVIERELMNEILIEQGFQQTGCTTNECIVEIGKLVGVGQMIGGSISKVGNIFSISARIISVESGEIISVATFDHKGDLGALLTVGMKNVALSLSNEKIGSIYLGNEKAFSQNTIELELLGPGTVGSLNYEKFFSKNIFGRIGFGSTVELPTMPVVVGFIPNVFNGRLEIAGGFTLVNYGAWSLNLNLPIISYRFKSNSGNFQFRPSLMIIIGSFDTGITPMIGLGFGYQY